MSYVKYSLASSLKKAVKPTTTACRLKHSLKTIAVTTALTLLSFTLPIRVRADPPGGTTGWSQSFEDNFDSFDDSKWIKTFTWGDGTINDGSVSYYSPNNLSVSNGNLTLKADSNSEGGRAYTGAIAQTFGKFYQTYGYFEARVKVPSGAGIAPFFSLSPEDTSWLPEVNIFEIPGAVGKNATTVWMTNHYVDGSGTSFVQGTWNAGTGLDQDYHTYGLLWQPGMLAWYVDGTERYSTTTGVPNKDCFIVLGLGVYDDDGSWTGSPANTSFPQYMSVDWVRAWKNSGGSSSNNQQLAVVAYQGGNLSGTSQSFGVGEYRANAGDFSTIGNDAINSLRVPQGLKVRACQNELQFDNGGSCHDYSPGDYNDLGDLDNQISYINVQAN
jgi:beta-glucanase (GH16 family)